MASNIVFDGTKGISLPSFTTTEKNAIVSPDTGAQIYDTTLKAICTYNGSAWITNTDNSSTQTLTNKTLTSPTISGAIMSTMASSVITSGTAVTASGTSVDFTGIPSWVNRITVMFSGVSTSGTSNLLARVGSGSFATSGYVSAATVPDASTATTSSTAGIILTEASTAADAKYGTVVLFNTTGNSWTSSNVIATSEPRLQISGGGITLGGTLDRVQITTVNGTDTFDAGSINIFYE